jgi:hypothetical protein
LTEDSAKVTDTPGTDKDVAETALAATRHAFLEKSFGAPSLLIHTAPPGSPAMDLAIWAPQARGVPYVTIATDGLSDQLLPSEKAPPDWACERAELIMYLPELFLDPKSQQIPWELAFFRMVADLPARAGIPLHAFFVIANGDPPKPFVAESLLTHAILLPPSVEAVEFRDGFDAPDGSSVEYLWLDFFTGEEANSLRTGGTVGLLQALAAGGHAPPTRFKRAALTQSKAATPGP